MNTKPVATVDPSFMLAEATARATDLLGLAAWRGVQAQHVVSTMRLVDTPEEQVELERLLEGSKPPLPTMKAPKHYLLSTPIRYRPQHASRFSRTGRRQCHRSDE